MLPGANDATAENAAKVRPALSHPVFFNMSSLRFGVQPYDVPIGHRSRRETYMVQRRARQHPMKMV
jgi:hypothetical protein